MAKRRPERRKTGQTSEIEERQIRAKILDALNNQNYIARTVTGIAKEAHVAPKRVVDTIVGDKELRMIVKVYPRRTAKGKMLLTTKKRFKETASLKDKFIDFFSTNQMSLEDAG